MSEVDLWPSTIGSEVAYELGKADRDHPRTLRLAEVVCRSDNSVNAEDLEPKDWLLPVFVSDGELCLRITEIPETAYVGYEHDILVASIHNDVFLRRMTIEPSTDDLEELVERFDPALTLRRRTPFQDGGRDD